MTFIVIFLHLVYQGPSERSDLRLDRVQLCVGVIGRIPLAQLVEGNVGVMTTRHGQGALHSDEQCSPSLLARSLGLSSLPIHVLDKLRRELYRVTGRLHAEVLRHELHRDSKVIEAGDLALERLPHH